MANTPTYVDATFYVQIEPEFARWDAERVTGAKAVRMSKSKPRSPIGGTMLAKLTVRVPVAVFRPLMPEAVVVVPESMAAVTPIEVTVSDPGSDD